MRTVKPVCASLLTRCIEHRGSFYLGVSVMTHLPLAGEPRLGSEQKLWPMLTEYAPDFIEQPIPRLRSEYLLYGSVYAPQDNPQQNYVDFGVRLGALTKKARAFGRRVMRGRRLEIQQAFEPLPISPEYAYGGPDYAENPAGTGHPSAAQGDALELPRIELHSHPWHPDVSVNKPALFGALDVMHPRRQQLAGSYDDEWLKNDYPGMPKDADWGIFNTTMPDQQTDNWQGDESFDLIHLHPQYPKLHGRLPAIKARVLLRFKGEEALHSLNSQLRTVLFLPSANAYVMIWQTQGKISTDDARDVDLIMAGFEHSSAPRALSHYEGVLSQRLGEDGMFVSLDESPMLPEGMAYDGLLDGMADLNRPLELHSLEKRMQKKGEEQMQRARQEVISHGLDPDEHAPPEKLPEPEPFPPVQELGSYLRKLEEEGQKKREELEAYSEERIKAAEKACVEQGQDFEIVRKEMANEDENAHYGPPKSCKARSLGALKGIDEHCREAGEEPQAEITEMLADKELHQEWEDTDEKLLDIYRMGAHHQKAHPGLDADQSKKIRQEVLERLEREGNIEGMDLTGVDLSGVNFQNACCRKVLMESAKLKGANLAHADFTQAVLAHADLSGAILVGCDLSGANLGKAKLEHTDARSVKLFDARLEGAVCRHTQFGKAVFSGLVLYEQAFTACDFNQADFSAASFIRARFEHCSMRSAVLDKTSFIECDFVNADWQGCNGRKTSFVNISLPESNFRGAELPESVWGGKIDLGRSVFDNGSLEKAYFDSAADLNRIDLSHVDGSQCDFSGCVMDGAVLKAGIFKQASFRNADLRDADLSAADLMEASLQNTLLQGAILRGTHLYGADLARIVTDKNTDASGAVYTKARVYPRHKP